MRKKALSVFVVSLLMFSQADFVYAAKTKIFKVTEGAKSDAEKSTTDVEAHGFIFRNRNFKAIQSCLTGEEISISPRIKNLSNHEVPTLQYEVKIDGKLLQAGQMNSIGSGANSAPVTIRHTFEKAGRYTVVGTLDPANMIKETNEGNNRSKAVIEVRAPQGAAAEGSRAAQKEQRAKLRVLTRYGGGPRKDREFKGAEVVVKDKGRILGKGKSPFEIEIEAGQTCRVTVEVPQERMAALGLSVFQLEDQTSEVEIPKEGWAEVFYYSEE